MVVGKLSKVVEGRKVEVNHFPGWRGIDSIQGQFGIQAHINDVFDLRGLALPSA
jgi:hypothetical protein